MTDEDRRRLQARDGDTRRHRGTRTHSGHHWMMVACCIPMVIIAIALVVTGFVSVGVVVIAVACLAMMAAMMFSMGGQQR
jgi:Flp pilus assembly protein TadB